MSASNPKLFAVGELSIGAEATYNTASGSLEHVRCLTCDVSGLEAVAIDDEHMKQGDYEVAKIIGPKRGSITTTHQLHGWTSNTDPGAAALADPPGDGVQMLMSVIGSAVGGIVAGGKLGDTYGHGRTLLRQVRRVQEEAVRHNRTSVLVAMSVGNATEIADVLGAEVLGTVDGAEGWFRSGDLGRKDADGFYYIVDRSKDMIIRGGYNVYPRELEEVLITHPAVSLVAVIGVPHESHGEEIKAVVVKNKDHDDVSEADLVAWGKEQFAAYKYPRIVEFRDELPMTATGKILKREI